MDEQQGDEGGKHVWNCFGFGGIGAQRSAAK